MFQTRQEVDKHVNNSLLKINNQTERNLRCFSFAKLYFNVGDYEQAVRYVTSYLSVKPKSAEGHHLLGKSLEKLGKNDAALDAYRTSLQQNPKQNNLVITVCELMAKEDVEVDNTRARHFCDLAQSLDPQNPIISNLKEKIIINDGKDPTEVSQFLIRELEYRPKDVNLRVRLLKHFLQNNMIKEAFKHASDIEEKKLDLFDNSLPWYEIFAEVLVRYQKDVSLSMQLSWEFWFLSVSILEKLAALSLDDHLDSIKTPTDYIASVFNFDQSFLKASQNINACPDKTLTKEFLNHYEGQLCFHLAVLALKQAKKGLMGFKEIQHVVLPLLFISYNWSTPDIHGVWFNSLTESRRKMILCWYKDGCFRCSQAGHILLSMAKDRRNILLEKADQYSSGIWRDQVFKKIFVTRDQQIKITTSYFISSLSQDPVIKLPDPVDLVKYDEVAQSVYPDSLHHYIWITLNSQNLYDFYVKTFEGLQYTIKNLNNCAAESLNTLDVQSFILCSAICAQVNLNNADTSLMYFNQDRPSVLPASITGNLGTLNQSKFLSAAYKMYKNEQTSNIGEIRLLLVRGIEVVRCVGNHGLDVRLLIQLAQVFAERATSLTKQTEIDANNSRAELYWKTALPLLEKLKNNYAVVYPKNRLFEYKNNKDLTQDEITSNIEKAKLFLGVQLMKKKEYEKAMHIFEGLKDPYASFYQSQMYKVMADSKTSQNKENVTSEMRSQNVILLSRARDCLYLTLDRLREPAQDKNHPLNVQLGTEIEKIERLLSRFDPDCANRNECDGMSDENVSDSSVCEHYLSTYTHHTSFQNGRDFSGKNESQLHSTPLRSGVQRAEARPSPERLDAQIRQIMVSKDLTMRNLMEQNRTLTELQRTLMEEIRDFKDTVKSLTSAVDDRAKHFVDLTHTVDDRLQNVTDMVQGMKKEINEIKKEINDIKKDQNKNTQLSDEDLYVLDPDYNTALDYNLGSNLGNTSTNLNPVVGNMYPQYQPSRLQGQTLLPGFGAHGPWSSGYFGLPYPYGAVGLQPPFLPQADQQLGPLGLPIQPAAAYQQSVNLNLGALIASQAQAPIQAKDSPKTTLNINSNAGAGIQSGPLLTQVPIKDNTKPLFPATTNVQSPVVNIPSSKAPPVNVVITSSDPLPNITKTSVAQPILSVTIPPQHIKGNVPKSTVVTTQPHNYQIPLPATNAVGTAPSILNKPAPVISTQSLLSSIPSPAISVVTHNVSPNVSLGLQIEKSLEETFSGDKTNISINKSNTSLEEYDPRPDFKPIVPLPEEVPVTTGEEKETELFCQRAKLFRHVNNNGIKEWKERGIGNIKILYNPETGKVRILMRRDQVHKICANHFLTKDMVLTPMAKSDNAYIWAAHDYADGEVVVEKFCVRFKTPDDAKKFANAFEQAKTKITNTSLPSVKSSSLETPKAISKVPEPKKTTEQSPGSINLGGFKFTSTPTFKPLEESKSPPKIEERKDSSAASPFVGFTFGTKTETPKLTSWGNLWKPPSDGSWTCKVCEIVNKAADSKCAACETSRDGSNIDDSKINSSGLKGINLDTGGQTFSFGMPSATKPATSTPTQKPEQPVQKFSFSVPPITKPDPEAVLSGFGDTFKPKVGTWECKTCYIRNEPSSKYCLSCETPKDDTVPKKESAPKGVNLETPGLKFTFGMPATSTTITVTSTTQQSTTTTTISTFGFPTTTPTTTTSPWKPPSITENVELQTKTKEDTEHGSFVFGSPQKHDFEFKPRSPRRISSGQGDESDGSYLEEEEPNVYFKPVIPLPDKVDVKTGEENEEVLYSHRAKLFRFAGGEWKERGLGDVKILKDNVTSKIRVVMRREQVLKICLNHWLTKDIEYLSKDDRTWLFYAPDFSEGELNRDQFCLRFKNANIAAEFKQAAVDALEQITDDVKTETEVQKSDEAKPSDIDSDVEFVSETKVTPEEEKEAIRLGLPPKFFAYRQRPDCTCDQCKKEDEYLKELFGKEPTTKTGSILNSTNSTLFGTPIISTPPSAGSIFGTPTTSFSFLTSTTSSPACVQKTETLKDLLQKGSVEITPKGGPFSFKFGQGPSDTVSQSITTQSKPQSPFLGQKSGNIFPVAGGTIFGGSNGGSLFGSETPKEGATANVFGGGTTSTESPAGGLFGSKKDTKDTDAGKYTFSSSSPGLFGSAPAKNIFGEKPSNIFGGTTTTTSTSNSTPTIFSSPFGSSSNSNSNIFANVGKSTSTSSIFSTTPITTNAAIFGSTGVSSNTSLFGSALLPAGGVFGSSTQTQGSPGFTPIFSPKPIFGSTIFDPKTEPKVTEASLTLGSANESEDTILKCDSGLSFANLAAQVDSKVEPSFAISTNSDKKPFAFLGAGAPVFGSTPTKTTKDDGADKEDEGAEHDDKDHDPHFDPIVPLPDQIVVSTGEENETALFNERAKLYRYDSTAKEWKERGVGQFKLLFDPANGTYRLLLRREQVHKVVLNQRLIQNFVLQPMFTSDKAWAWVGHNFVDDEFKLEQLAVRFKNCELAQAFKKSVEEAVQKIHDNKEQQNITVPTTVQNFGKDDGTGSSGHNESAYQGEHHDDDEDDDEDDSEDDEDERSIMFTKRCTLSEQTENDSWQQAGMGELQVYYDPDLYAAKICVSDDSGLLLSNTLIGINTVMQMDGRDCWWKAVEWADESSLKWRTLKVTFSSPMAAQEFHSNYLEGLNFAHEVGIVDELPNDEDHLED